MEEIYLKSYYPMSGHDIALSETLDALESPSSLAVFHLTMPLPEIIRVLSLPTALRCWSGLRSVSLDLYAGTSQKVLDPHLFSFLVSIPRLVKIKLQSCPKYMDSIESRSVLLEDLRTLQFEGSSDIISVLSVLRVLRLPTLTDLTVYTATQVPDPYLVASLLPVLQVTLSPLRLQHLKFEIISSGALLPGPERAGLSTPVISSTSLAPLLTFTRLQSLLLHLCFRVDIDDNVCVCVAAAAHSRDHQRIYRGKQRQRQAADILGSRSPRQSMPAAWGDHIASRRPL